MKNLFFLGKAGGMRRVFHALFMFAFIFGSLRSSIVPRAHAATFGSVTFDVTILGGGPLTLDQLNFNVTHPDNTQEVWNVALLGTTMSGTDDGQYTIELPLPTDYVFAQPMGGQNCLLVGNGTVMATIAGDPQVQNATCAYTLQYQPSSSLSADLELTHAVSPATAQIGDTVTYTVTVHNLTDVGATQVEVTDLLPSTLSVVSANPSVNTYDASSGVWTIGFVGPLQSETLVIQAKVDGGSNSIISSSASVTSTTPDPDSSNNIASVDVAVAASADVGVTVTVSDPTPFKNANVTLTVTVTNSGPDPAQGVVVTDLVPNGLDVMDGSASTGIYTASNGKWTIGTLAPGQTETLTLDVNVVGGLGDTVTNEASGAATSFDPHTANNISSVTLVILNPALVHRTSDLSVTNDASPTSVNVGDSVTFTITAKNLDPGETVVGTTIMVTLPQGLALTQSTVSKGSYNAPSGTWLMDIFGPGETQTLTLTATVQPNAPTSMQTTATIGSVINDDPDMANNTATAQLQLISASTPVDVQLTHTVSPASAVVGDTVSYIITAKNVSENVSSQVTVTDFLSNALSFVSASATKGTYDASSGVWTVGDLIESQLETLTIQAKVASAPNPTISVDASATSTTPDPDTANNAATATLNVQVAQQTAATSGGSGTGGGGGGSSGCGGLCNPYSPSIPAVTATYQTSSGTVSGSSTTELVNHLQTLGVSIHSLVKLPSDGNLNTQNDSAVYYIGADGARHAFPNDKVYFTWYQDFANVKIVTLSQLASIPLGRNVTYKPGVRMVKFLSLPNVFVVEKGSVLRWVKTQEIATGLYGSTWKTQVDDISDAFYMNYSFGSDVTGASQYQPQAAQVSVTTISDSLK